MSTGDTVIEELLPGPAARAPGLAYAESIWWGLTEIESGVLDLRDGLHDLDIAEGFALDLLGSWVGEGRFGLDDADYRRIIAGRRVAQAGGVTPPAVIRGWRRVTGDDDAIMNEAPSEVLLFASVPFQVDSAWLARAAQVTRDSIGNGRRVYAVVSSPGAYIWGTSDYSVGFSADFGG